MKRYATALIASFALATVCVAAQGGQTTPPPPPAQQAAAPADQTPKTPDISITGCVLQGSGPTVFILDGAKLNPTDRAEKGKTYVIVAGAEDLDLAKHVNHSVSVKGIAENKTPPTPPAGQKVAEKDLPRFTAKILTMVADTCTSAGQ